MTYEKLPRVYLFGTGGTISFVGESRTDFANYSYHGRQLTIEEMLARVPEAQSLAEVLPEQIINVGSTEVYPEHWLTLANRINRQFSEDPSTSGVAVTHGTATLEETAYFLNLTVRDSRPVAVTGAMRPPSAMGTDADNNLLDAIRVAASPNSAGRGALVILNNEIQSARDVTKTDSYRVETFQSGHMGFLGYADSDGAVTYYRRPERRHTAESEFDVANRRSAPGGDRLRLRRGGGNRGGCPGGRRRQGYRRGRIGQWRFPIDLHGRAAPGGRRWHPGRDLDSGEHRTGDADPALHGRRLHRCRQLAPQEGQDPADAGTDGDVRPRRIATHDARVLIPGSQRMRALLSRDVTKVAGLRLIPAIRPSVRARQLRHVVD